MGGRWAGGLDVRLDLEKGVGFGGRHDAGVCVRCYKVGERDRSVGRIVLLLLLAC